MFFVFWVIRPFAKLLFSQNLPYLQSKDFGGCMLLLCPPKQIGGSLNQRFLTYGSRLAFPFIGLFFFINVSFRLSNTFRAVGIEIGIVFPCKKPPKIDKKCQHRQKKSPKLTKKVTIDQKMIFFYNRWRHSVKKK